MNDIKTKKNSLPLFSTFSSAVTAKTQKKFVVIMTIIERGTDSDGLQLRHAAVKDVVTEHSLDRFSVSGRLQYSRELGFV